MSATWVAPAELNIYAAGEAGAALAALFAAAAPGPELRIDLGGVGEIDAAGLQVLLAAALKGRREGRAVRFTGVPAHVRERFEQFGLAGHLQPGAHAAAAETAR